MLLSSRSYFGFFILRLDSRRVCIELAVDDATFGGVVVGVFVDNSHLLSVVVECTVGLSGNVVRSIFLQGVLTAGIASIAAGVIDVSIASCFINLLLLFDWLDEIDGAFRLRPPGVVSVNACGCGCACGCSFVLKSYGFDDFVSSS